MNQLQNILNTNPIYILHLDKDVGRHKWLKSSLEELCNTNDLQLSAFYYKGIFSREIKDNLLWDQKNRTKSFVAAKRARIQMLKDFLKTDATYFVLFEDDIIFHKKFIEYFKQINDFINTNNNWRLIYMGIVNEHQLSPDNFINILPKDKVCSGAYGVFINRSICQELIERDNLPTIKNAPFDDYFLGYIQKKYYGECYVTSPHIVLPDVTSSNIRGNRTQNDIYKSIRIDIKNYIIPKQFPIFVIVNNNSHRFEQLLDHMTTLQPFGKLIILYLNNVQATQVFDSFKISDMNSINNIISDYYKNNQDILPYYMLTNNLIHFDTTIKDYLWDNILEKLNEYSSITFPVRDIRNIQNTTTFVTDIITIKKIDQSIISNYTYTTTPFYHTATCDAELNSDYYGCHIDDIVDRITTDSLIVNINYYKDIIDTLNDVILKYIIKIIKTKMTDFVYNKNSMYSRDRLLKIPLDYLLKNGLERKCINGNELHITVRLEKVDEFKNYINLSSNIRAEYNLKTTHIFITN